MSEEYDYIKVVNNIIQGQIALNILSNEHGIVIDEFNENQTGWKIQFSLDNRCLIQELLQEDIVLIGKCEANVFLERLIRDISSEDLKTRQSASEVLCNFIESSGSKINFNVIIKSIWLMVERLAIEDNYDVEQKLSEGIFEFVGLKRLNEVEERNLIIHLAKLDKDTLFCYLDDEDYLVNKEVREFINRGRK